MKYSGLKGIFAEEQTNRGLLVIGLDQEGRRVEVLFHISTGSKADWKAISIKYM